MTLHFFSTVVSNIFILLTKCFIPRSGDGTARLWPINESGVGTPLVLRHQFKELENHKNAPKDVTSLEWNVSVQL